MGLIKAWSYSRWSTYDTCPLQAKFKFIDKIPEDENAAMIRGSKAHDDLAAYLRGDIPDDVAPGMIGWDHFGELLEGLRELEPLVEQQWGFNSKWCPTGWFGKDTWLRVVLDSAVLYEDGSADVVDHKTGKARNEHARQAELYAVAMMLRYPSVNQVTVRFWYLDHGSESVYRFGKIDVEGLVAKWSARVKPMLNDTIFAPKPGQHCKWCYQAKSVGGACRYG
jgi:hypothetical protein